MGVPCVVYMSICVSCCSLWVELLEHVRVVDMVVIAFVHGCDSKLPVLCYGVATLHASKGFGFVDKKVGSSAVYIDLAVFGDIGYTEIAV
jgi:hypothetical protein